MDILQTSDKVALLQEKIQDVHTCMFTSIDGAGRLVSQPMTNQQVGEDGCLWFFASSQGVLARNIAANPVVNISFCEPADKLFVSASGRARGVADSEKMNELWNPLLAAWFPQGVGDPHLELVRVDLDSAEFWDARASRMVQLFDLAVAAMRRRPPQIRPGEHGTICL